MTASLLAVMHPLEVRRTWRTLTPVEKQDRLDRLRRRQQHDVARDVRVLQVHRA